jgi:glutamine amidotransferase
MIAVVDLKISNLASVLQALHRVGAADCEFASPANVERAEAIVLPGVGAFGDGMASLREQDLVGPIKAAAAAGKPVFGICLGMQLLARSSTEFGDHEGLGLVGGAVRRLEPAQRGDRVPNIGWCDVTPARPGVLFPDGAGGCFYHVHSYHFVPEDARVVAASIRFGGADVAVAIESGNLFGVQFHAEKSQDDGLQVLSNFLRHARARRGGAA